ncbi:MAG: tartronate-semialdehyde synthase [Solirubrobacteraceae bacterium]|jgi:glyoxylate carboligase|nr:tartronate-semialdehyde synthase [Solirubrobacteraceae bacterium]
MADSMPMICITGRAPTGVLHEEAFRAVDIVEDVEVAGVRSSTRTMGLIRQAEKYGYDENDAVDLSFDNGETVGIDHVGVYERPGAVVAAPPERD